MSGTGLALLETSLAQWQGIVDRPVVSQDGLISNLEALYAAIYHTNFAALDVAEVKAIAEPAAAHLFDLYLRLRDRIPEWSQQGFMTGAAPLALRNAMRVIRYTCDILGEVGYGYPVLQSGESTHAGFAGPDAWTQMHPSRPVGERVSFRSGDVLLVRGRLHNSAAIARIGDADSQFSHVGIVHIDSDRRSWLVEALIEDGAMVTPLAAALGHGIGRAVLFRHRNSELALQAAAFIHARVEGSRKPFGGWIPYDFSMELDESDHLFCSKLVREAYRGASKGAVALPSFGTRLTMTNRDFFDRIGVTAVNTFAPADMEAEPGFDIVAEWRDYRVTSQLRMQDLLMSKMFDWMDAHGYEFRESLGIGLMALGGRMSGLLPDIAKSMLVQLGIPKVPPNMTARTVGTIAMLHKTADPILQRLLALDRAHIKTTGRPLHPREVQAELENIRTAAGGRIGYLAIPS